MQNWPSPSATTQQVLVCIYVKTCCSSMCQIAPSFLRYSHLFTVGTMGMFHSTSGKAGYVGYSVPCRVRRLRSGEIHALLRREDELRASDETQRLYSKDDTCEWLRDVTIDVQKKALRQTLPELVLQYGIDEMLIALNNLRFDPRVMSDPRLNRLTVCTYGTLDSTRTLGHHHSRLNEDTHTLTTTIDSTRTLTFSHKD